MQLTLKLNKEKYIIKKTDSQTHIKIINNKNEEELIIWTKRSIYEVSRILINLFNKGKPLSNVVHLT